MTSETTTTGGTAGAARGRRLMADRLTRLLAADLAALEAGRAAAEPDEVAGAAAIKARVDAVSQISRTLEKLLELRRLETLTLEEASREDEAETERLRVELMRRLRAVDARRAEGAGLIGEDAR